MPCAHRPHEQHLRGGERERLLVQVDEVPCFPERPPEGPWIIEEQGGVSADRGDPLDGFAGAGAQAKTAGSSPSGITCGRPGKPRRTTSAPAASLQTLTPAAPRNAHRCRIRKGSGSRLSRFCAL